MPSQQPDLSISPDFNPTFIIEAHPASQAVQGTHQNPPSLDVFQLAYEKFGVMNSYVEFEINYDNNVSGWLSLLGMTVHRFFVPDGVGNKNIVPVLGDISNLPNGNYTAEINFTAYADDLNGLSAILYGFTTYTVQLEISGGNVVALGFSQPKYHVVFNRQTGILSGETAVTVANPANLDLGFAAEHFQSVSHVQTAFTITGQDLATDPTLPDSGLVDVFAYLKKPDGTNVSSAIISLAIVKNGEISINPTSLNFQINKAQSPIATQTLNILNPLNSDYTLEGPPWLSFSANSGNTSGPVTVSANGSTLLTGGYSGNVLLKYGTKTITIPVTLSVIGFIKFQANAGDFCKDVPPVFLNRQNAAGKFVRVLMEIDFGTETKTNSYLLPYVNDKAEFTLGEKVHKMFPNIREQFFTQNIPAGYRNSAIVKLTVTELSSDYATLLTESITGIKLFPGKKPLGYPLLTNHLHRSRKRRNEIFVSQVSGDAIELQKLQNFSGPKISSAGKEIKLYDFPENFVNVLIQWENQNLAIEWAGFSGEYKISPEYSHLYSRSIFGLQNEKYDTQKGRIITLNTGFILKEEQKMICEIIESACVFLKIEGVVYRAFATTQKITELESEAEVISKDLEFLIVE